jgi:hypothetical protein
MTDQGFRSVVDWTCLIGLGLCEVMTLATQDYRWAIFACGFAVAFLTFEGWLAVTGTTRR